MKMDASNPKSPGRHQTSDRRSQFSKSVSIGLAAIALLSLTLVSDTAAAQFAADPCSNGIVIADPEENPELVADCMVLWHIRDALAGDASLNWGPQLSLDDWQGIGVGGEASSARVRGISLVGHAAPSVLTGKIPAELGDLTGLLNLNLAGNRLAGSIPAELGSLVNLQSLLLNHNRLTGSIPEELGAPRRPARAGAERQLADGPGPRQPRPPYKPGIAPSRRQPADGRHSVFVEQSD